MKSLFVFAQENCVTEESAGFDSTLSTLSSYQPAWLSDLISLG